MANFAFIGTYAVKPVYQNMGIGSDIWKEVIKHIGNQSNISLVSATDLMFKKYCSMFGSIIVDEKVLILYSTEHNQIKYELLVDRIKDVSVITINEANLNSVSIYDTNICGFNRESMLREAIKQTDTLIIAAIDENNGQTIVGFCKLSLSNTNFILAQPLYADNVEIAELLLSKGCKEISKINSKGLIVYSWDSNISMKSIAHKIGLQQERKANKIYTKMIIDCDYHRIFAVSSPHFFPF